MKSHVLGNEKRLVPVEIAGTTYYLNFSVKAASAMEILKDGDKAEKSWQDEFDDVIDVLFLLIEQGAEYRRLFLKEENPPRLTREELGVVIGIEDSGKLIDLINDAMNSSGQQAIEVESKNAPAAEGLSI